MNIFGIGLPEMALIFTLALLVFGPKKLPEIGRSMGKAIRGFQEASKEFESEFKREAEQIERIVKEPMQATLEEPDPPALAAATEAPEAELPIVQSEPVESVESEPMESVESEPVESVESEPVESEPVAASPEQKPEESLG
ncbi:MAG: twin-arginine translocase TatA/TatE family subunit [Leptolyngbya sp.]|nr:MAG: twin-arginine translocase TatA/TatE family subunit [Leptolyngbya sp.]